MVDTRNQNIYYALWFWGEQQKRQIDGAARGPLTYFSCTKHLRNRCLSAADVRQLVPAFLGPVGGFNRIVNRSFNFLVVFLAAARLFNLLSRKSKPAIGFFTPPPARLSKHKKGVKGELKGEEEGSK
jgi:hypothetical protein